MDARTPNLEYAVRKWSPGVEDRVDDRAEATQSRVANGHVVEHVGDLVYAGGEKLYKQFLNDLKQKCPFGSEDDAAAGLKY